MAALAGNFPAILAATIAVFLIGALGALMLSRVSGVERKSTFFASIPGGAMAMAVLAERYGAQIAPVAVAHSLRGLASCHLDPVRAHLRRHSFGIGCVPTESATELCDFNTMAVV